MTISYVKILNGKVIKIKGIPNIPKLLKKGFTVTKNTTIGRNTKLESFSPLTRNQAWERHKKNAGMGIPF